MPCDVRACVWGSAGVGVRYAPRPLADATQHTCRVPGGHALASSVHRPRAKTEDVRAFNGPGSLHVIQADAARRGGGRGGRCGGRCGHRHWWGRSRACHSSFATHFRGPRIPPCPRPRRCLRGRRSCPRRPVAAVAAPPAVISRKTSGRVRGRGIVGGSLRGRATKQAPWRLWWWRVGTTTTRGEEGGGATHRALKNGDAPKAPPDEEKNWLRAFISPASFSEQPGLRRLASGATPLHDRGP